MCAVCDLTALIQALYVQLCQASPGGSMACHTDHARSMVLPQMWR